VNHKLMQSPRAIHVYADMWGDIRGRCIYPNEKRRVYLNRGAGARPQFVDVAERAGLTSPDNSRGVALADFDRDGRLDVLIANQHGAPTLLRNALVTGSTPNAWVALRLDGSGRACTRDAAGSTVLVYLPGQPPIVRETQHANGFAAQDDATMYIGLGTSGPGPVRATVRWCGQETREYSLAPNRVHRLAR
jgi:hypothetical protein